MKIKTLAAISLLLIISMTSSARLGETLDQCKSRYKHIVGSTTRNGVSVYLFIKKDFLIGTYFINGYKKCQSIGYVIPAGSAAEKILSSKNNTETFIDLLNPQTNKKYVLDISNNYLNTLLEVNNNNNSKWQKVEDHYYVRSDAKAVAFYIKRKTLVVMTPLYLKKAKDMLKEQKKETRKQLKGF